MFGRVAKSSASVAIPIEHFTIFCTSKSEEQLKHIDWGSKNWEIFGRVPCCWSDSSSDYSKLLDRRSLGGLYLSGWMQGESRAKKRKKEKNEGGMDVKTQTENEHFKSREKKIHHPLCFLELE